METFATARVSQKQDLRIAAVSWHRAVLRRGGNGIRQHSHPVGADTKLRGNKIAVTRSQHHNSVGDPEHRSGSELNWFRKPLKRIAIVIIMKVQYHRQTQQPRKMHQDNLANCTAAARYMDVQKRAPRPRGHNGEKASRKMPGRERDVSGAARIEDSHIRTVWLVLPGIDHIADHPTDAATMFETPGVTCKTKDGMLAAALGFMVCVRASHSAARRQSGGSLLSAFWQSHLQSSEINRPRTRSRAPREILTGSVADVAGADGSAARSQMKIRGLCIN